jgi:hypothetical protein
MFTKSVNFKIYIFIEILLGISIVATIVLSFLSHNSIKFDIREVTDMSSNWIKQPFLEIKQNYLSLEMCPTDFTPLIEDIWPGTVEGCNCLGVSNVTIPNSYADQINRMTCSSDLQLGGCKPVEEITLKKYFFWKGKPICVRKSQKKYQDYYKNTAEKNTSCPIGYKQCGVLDSVGNLMCEEVSQVCPINKIIVQDSRLDAPTDHNYKKIQLDGNMTLYSTNEAIDQQILSEIKLSEGNVCVYPGEINVKWNLKQYILDKEYYNYKCRTNINASIYDTRFALIDSVKKSYLYSENGLLNYINKLPSYPFSSLETNIDLYSRSYIGWKKSCNRDSLFNFFEIIANLESEKDSVSNYKIAIIVLSFLLLLYFIITVLIKWLTHAKNNPTLFNLIELGQCLFAVVMIILAFMCINRSENYTYLFADDFNCGDKFTNVSIILLGRKFETSVGYDKAIIALSFFNSFAYWGLGIGDWAQSPIPNPQSPIFISYLYSRKTICISYLFLYKNSN